MQRRNLWQKDFNIFELWNFELENNEKPVQVITDNCDGLNPYCFGGWLGLMGAD